MMENCDFKTCIQMPANCVAKKAPFSRMFAMKNGRSGGKSIEIQNNPKSDIRNGRKRTRAGCQNGLWGSAMNNNTYDKK
jgi:hypothetical protein